MISDEIDTKIVYENNQFLRILEAISNSNIYKTYTPELSNQHKISHIQKVLLFSQIIAQNEKLNQNEIVEEIRRTYYPQSHFLHNQILHQWK